MADLEDANCPTWDNNMTGQINLRDANLRTIELTDGKKQYRLKPEADLATLMVRKYWDICVTYLS